MHLLLKPEDAIINICGYHWFFVLICVTYLMAGDVDAMLTHLPGKHVKN